MRMLIALLLALSLVARAQAPEELIPVASGAYRIVLPESGEPPFPVVFHLHGWGSSANNVMNNRNFVGPMLARGYAVIAPMGLPNAGMSQRDWNVDDGSDHPRDDALFFAEIIADAEAKGWIDPARLLMTGFSRGGSMVWDIACKHPDMAVAYAPIAGAFWLPMPEACVGPVDLFHVHGWADRTVPVEGRSVANGRFIQGDAFVSLEILRASNQVPRYNDPEFPTESRIEGDRWYRAWTSPTGHRIDLMLHPGGHSVPEGWVNQTLDWFEQRLASRGY